jgi:hypothetical protein
LDGDEVTPQLLDSLFTKEKIIEFKNSNYLRKDGTGTCIPYVASFKRTFPFKRDCMVL